MQHKTIETKITIYTYSELNPTQQSLIDKAKEQINKAYAPYSGFQVGAAVELANGKIFAGSNQENVAYPSGLCAERVALFYANAQYPDVPVKSMAIAAYTKGAFVSEPITPCGSCRQVMLESEMRFENNISILLYGSEKIIQLENVKSLLPLSFVKSSLQ